jgi:hypothetical protein
MRKFIICFFSMLFLSVSLKADSFSFSFFQNMTDNIFQNRYSGRDQLSNVGFYIDKDFSKISVFTEGGYSYLFENPSLSYYIQDVGLDYLHPLSDKAAFYFSLVGQGAFYRTDYNDFNSLSLNFMAAFKTYLSQTSILKSNYSLDYKSFGYSLFDFISHSLSVSFDKYFQTRTTFQSEINWGLKFFLHPYSSREVIVVEERGGHQSGRRSYIFVPKTQPDGQTVQIFSFAGLIAQGFGANVGFNISGLKQWYISGENPFTSVEEFYMVENPSYDKFSWAGYQLGAQIKLLIPWNIELRIGYTVASKEFPGIESMNLDEELLGMTREDKRRSFETRLEKNFPRFSFFLSYAYIDNDSNDPFFDWHGNFFSAGIELNMLFGGRK